jgi:DHA2 family multidrug resistance protein
MVKDPPHMEKIRQESKRQPIDFTGLVLIGTGLGALQVVLDKGQRDDWFASNFITICTIAALCAIVAFAIWEWRQQHPIVQVRLLKNPNFAVANLLMLTLGIALFGTTVLIPQFLQVEMGYTAQKAGEVLSPGGFVILLLMPLVGFLMPRVDARYMIALGFLSTAFALYHMTNLNLGIDFRTAVMWRIYQAAGLAFLFVPINTISYADMPPEASNQGSGMINLMRNVGGSIGISAVTTLIARRQQVHQAYLADHLSPANPNVQAAISQLTNQFAVRSGEHQAAQQAWFALYGNLRRQASVLAYIDTFWIMGTLCLLAIGLLFFAKRIKPGQAVAAH